MSLVDQLISIIQAQGADIKALNTSIASLTAALALKMDKDRIRSYGIALDFPSLGPGETNVINRTVVGVTTADAVLLNYATNANANISMLAEVVGTDTVRVRAWNESLTATIDQLNGNYVLFAFKSPI